MTVHVLVPISTGFEEIEATTIIDVLRRAGIAVTVAGLTDGPVTGRSGITMLPDTPLDKALGHPYEMIVLPGGQPNADTLRDDKRVITALQKAHEAGTYVAAICAAPAALTRAGLLEHRKATIYPGCEKNLPDGSFVPDRVVVEEKIITSRGPGTAMEFALTLVSLLVGEEIAKKVAGALLAP
ncbi:MAG: DJ-1/PfpI family protein [Deltaproteobacteria bacterium]|nr:DJ-1/PfpI family protein [Deltaproteobacteria bacterium]MBN2673353.1 DJ-1/PfpI family protein [Deltaproteobacteria bacterium]